MKLNPTQISRMIWSTFKDSLSLDGYHLRESMKNIKDIIMGDAVDDVANIYIMFNKTGTVEFAHLQITKVMESNTIDIYDSIDFDEHNNVLYGNKTNSVTFAYDEIRNSWISMFI